VIANLTSSSTVMHARLTEHLTPFNDALQMPNVTGVLDLSTDAGRMLLDRLVTQQATIIAFSNDFMLLMWLVLASIPLVFIIGTSRVKLRKVVGATN
jgi:DHA2 family multidrug resistance protein